MRYLLLLFVFSSLNLAAQKDYQKLKSKLIGYWEGAFIESNSYQKIDMNIYEKDGKLYSLQVMEEWHPTFGEFEIPLETDSVRTLMTGTGYGRAKLRLDADFLEITGQITDSQPALYLHFKKTAAPPAPDYKLEETTIPSGGTSLYGHLHLPIRSKVKSALVLVGGRGCSADATKYNLYAKILRDYGIAVFAYQKRGNGKSGGDCETASIEDLAQDLSAVKKYLEKHPAGFEKIGALGISAGAWTMTAAEQKGADFDFLISVVGPAMSVAEQQTLSTNDGVKFYGLSATDRRDLLTYLDLMLHAEANTASFEKMSALLKKAEQNDWAKLLENTDIPADAAAIEKLWVRRHAFDPKPVLRAYNKPFLGVYGERDWIVSPEQNIKNLRDCFAGKEDKLRTHIAYNAEHGMETEGKYVTSGFNLSYKHFYRISPDLKIALVDFLREFGLVE